jgi:tRNA (uracil-5-)-methyltransferase TRM9
MGANKEKPAQPNPLSGEGQKIDGPRPSPSLSGEGHVFDRIAESWYRVRHWPLLKQELEEVAGRWRGLGKNARPSHPIIWRGGGGRLLNVGCAHGPDFLPFAQGFELWGMDSAPGMIRQAMRYSAKFHLQVNLVVADAISLPFPDNSFDWAISVATYHHIKGSEERERAFRELIRVLKPGGEAFLTVWNRCQPRFWLSSSEQQVPWRLKGEIVYRYYHLFSYGELKKLLIRAGFEIISMFPERRHRFPIKNLSRNICALARK